MNVFLATRVGRRLREIEHEKQVNEEALVNMLLTLVLGDEKMVNQAVQMVKLQGLGGQAAWDSKLGKVEEGERWTGSMW